MWNRMTRLIVFLALSSVSIGPLTAQQSSPLPRAHAHNDYLHARPLQDALSQGFMSVEADIFLERDQLLVAHTAKETRPDRTLQSLYLDPLRARIADNGGRVYRQADAKSSPGTFWLLIDIKSEAESTYRALHSVLENYADLLTTVDRGLEKKGAIQIVISGNRPKEFIAGQVKRYCGIDGRVADLDSSVPAHLMPMISDNWGLQFLWRGVGPMTQTEQKRLDDIVGRSHAKGRIVRFWATPENGAVWSKLVETKVDLINTDQLEILANFLRALP